MKFDNNDIVILDSIGSKEKAEAYILFLASELRRHHKDINDILAKITEVQKRFNIHDADLNMG